APLRDPDNPAAKMAKPAGIDAAYPVREGGGQVVIHALQNERSIDGKLACRKAEGRSTHGDPQRRHRLVRAALLDQAGNRLDIAAFVEAEARPPALTLT